MPSLADMGTRANGPIAAAAQAPATEGGMPRDERIRHSIRGRVLPEARNHWLEARLCTLEAKQGVETT